MGQRWFTTNIHTEVAAYPQTGKYVVINNANEAVATEVVDGGGRKHVVTLGANASQWFDFEGNRI
jgi:hypothetical protein